jgi:hypothetical protein
MKSVIPLSLSRCRRTTSLLVLGTISLLAPLVRADVEIARRWASTAPVINGNVSPGEWSYATPTAISVGGVNYAQMRTMNDANYLYVLLDVYYDTVNDPLNSTPYGSDFFALYFDKDLNRAVTPNVDFFYSSCLDARPFVKAIELSQSSSTGCQTVDPNSLGAEGFGTSFNSATPHRIWEFRLSLSELGVDTSTWTTSAGTIPKVRMNVSLFSLNPSFYISQPDPSASPDMSLMYQVDLAASPSFPPGSTGPIFAGVGLVPATYIDSGGYANINISGYYYATNAPWGGNLNVFGNWLTLRYAYGAARYRVLYSKDGGPYTRLRQTWTNFKYDGTTWVPNAIGPDANDSYPVPVPWEIWYLPNLLISWQTGTFPEGTYTLKLELLNGSGTLLASPPGNSLKLFVVNTPPSVAINDMTYNGSTICECGIVTQGDPTRGFTFEITAIDPNGALNAYALGGTFGNNQSVPTITSDTYTPSHINQDGPKHWNGVTNIFVPSGLALPWRANRSCAYTFILSASSRVQNGYGLVFPYVDYKKSLTILLGTGVGGTACPP